MFFTLVKLLFYHFMFKFLGSRQEYEDCDLKCGETKGHMTE